MDLADHIGPTRFFGQPPFIPVKETAYIRLFFGVPDDTYGQVAFGFKAAFDTARHVMARIQPDPEPWEDVEFGDPHEMAIHPGEVGDPHDQDARDEDHERAMREEYFLLDSVIAFGLADSPFEAQRLAQEYECSVLLHPLHSDWQHLMNAMAWWGHQMLDYEG